MHNYCVRCDELLVPFWILPAGNDRDGFPLLEVLLPARKVDEEAEVVPSQHAGQACTDCLRIWGLDVLVWFLVYM